MRSVARLNRLAAACLMGGLIIAAQPRHATAQELSKTFVMHAAAKPVPRIKFEDGQGQARSLADFEGKAVVLNLWATWCVPCRREMPALDRLQGSLGGSEFAVVPVSVDRGIEVVAKFYSDIGIRNLPMYVDTSGKAIRELGAMGLPTTLVLDRDGKEVARIVGPAEWDAPEVAELLKPVIAKPSDPIKRARHDADPPGPLARVFRWLNLFLVN